MQLVVGAPGQAVAARSDARGFGDQRHRQLSAAAQRVILVGDRHAQPQHVAHAQSLDGQIGRQDAGQFALFERFFAAQYGKLLAARQRVDHLPVADDRQFVDDQIALVRRPADRHIAVLRQFFGRVELDDGVGVVPDRRAIDTLFDIQHLQPAARCSVGQGRGLRPVGGRLIERLLARQRRPDRTNQ